MSKLQQFTLSLLLLLPAPAFAATIKDGSAPRAVPVGGGGSCAPVNVSADGHNCSPQGAINDCMEDLADACPADRMLTSSNMGTPYPWGGWGAFFECGPGDAWQVDCTGTCTCIQ